MASSNFPPDYPMREPEPSRGNPTVMERALADMAQETARRKFVQFLIARGTLREWPGERERGA